MSTVKTIGEFVALVRLMRQYQKVYFAEKNTIALRQTEKYEALVDKAIAERDERNQKQQQPDLPGCTSNARSNL
jgi:hypothetical protein